MIKYQYFENQTLQQSDKKTKDLHLPGILLEGNLPYVTHTSSRSVTLPVLRIQLRKFKVPSNSVDGSRRLNVPGRPGTERRSTNEGVGTITSQGPRVTGDLNGMSPWVGHKANVEREPPGPDPVPESVGVSPVGPDPTFVFLRVFTLNSSGRSYIS